MKTIIAVNILALISFFVSCSSFEVKAFKHKHRPPLPDDMPVHLFLPSETKWKNYVYEKYFMSDGKKYTYNENYDDFYYFRMKYLNKSNFEIIKKENAGKDYTGEEVYGLSGNRIGTFKYKGRGDRLPGDLDLFDQVRKNGGNVIIIDWIDRDEGFYGTHTTHEKIGGIWYEKTFEGAAGGSGEITCSGFYFYLENLK